MIPQSPLRGKGKKWHPYRAAQRGGDRCSRPGAYAYRLAWGIPVRAIHSCSPVGENADSISHSVSARNPFSCKKHEFFVDKKKPDKPPSFFQLYLGFFARICVITNAYRRDHHGRRVRRDHCGHDVRRQNRHHDVPGGAWAATRSREWGDHQAAAR